MVLIIEAKAIILGFLIALFIFMLIRDWLIISVSKGEITSPDESFIVKIDYD